MKDIKEVLLQAYEFRYACKQFDAAKKISDADFDTILETGRLSPSSWGLEPWRFLVIRDSPLRKKLFPIAWGAQNSLNGASHIIIFLARRKKDTLAGSQYMTHLLREVHHMPDDVAADMTAAYKGWQTTDFNLLESDRTIFDWACRQTYVALGNMMTTAALLGIDSCPIEGFNRQAVEALLTQEGYMDADHFRHGRVRLSGRRPAPPENPAVDDGYCTVHWINKSER